MPAPSRAALRRAILTLPCLLLAACAGESPGPERSGEAAAPLEPAGTISPGGAPPASVPRYGVWEIAVANRNPYPNRFLYEVIALEGIFTAPSGREIRHRGFYDGDGQGGAEGTVWKIRFMPDETGNWRYTLSFSDRTPITGATGSFRCEPSDIPGPPRLDPSNPRFLSDSRGDPIHWRGYAIKHRLYREPLTPEGARAYLEEVVDGMIVGGGYNATYLAVPNPDNLDPHGRRGRGSQALWGDFSRYDLQAARFLDILIRGLHERRIWTAGWITFAVQSRWEDLWDHHREWLAWFTARYGAYYNYFLWSPVWEVAELEDWVQRTNVMMGYLASIDPWRRLQGIHDRARPEWAGWQSIHARQNQARDVERGNNRSTGVDPSMAPYEKVILGAEDLWEMAAGHYGQPRDGTEVRRGLWGELLAGILPMYDENDDFAPPAGGIGNGEGEPFVRIAYDWWYTHTRYRDPDWALLNQMLSTDAGQRCSGIPGEEYVAFREENGSITLRLGSVAGNFTVSWLDPVTGRTWEDASVVTGGADRMLEPPFEQHDVVVHLRREPAGAGR